MWKKQSDSGKKHSPFPSQELNCLSIITVQIFSLLRAFNIFQVYQYFTIYRQYIFFIKIGTIFMNILCYTQEVPKTILGG